MKRLLLAAVLVSTLNAQEGKNAWSIKTYRLPDPGLVGGFISSEHGQLKAPPMPAADAKEEAIIEFVKKSHFAVRDRLTAEGITLPPGTLTAFDPANKTVAVRTTQDTHDRISALATRVERELSKFVVCHLEIIEADAAEVRTAVTKAMTKADHRDAWEALDALIPANKARVAASLRLETKSGARATAEGGEQRLYNSEMTLDESKRSSTANEERRAGTRLELEPVIGPDGRTMEMNLSVEHHHGPPLDRWDTINVSGEKTVESPLVDFHVARVTTGLTMLGGMTKLLGIWRPEGGDAAQNAGKLQAAFLTANIVTLLPALDTRVEQILRTHGEKVEKTPSAPPAAPAGAPKGIITRTFHLPPDILTMDDPNPSMAAGGAAPADPFAAAPGEAKLMVRMTAMDILKSKGIPFPEGSSATYTASTGELLVRNTQPNMQLVEAFIASRKQHAARTLVTTVHVIEGDAATIRKLSHDTATLSDHSAAWKNVEQAVSEGRLKILRSTFTEGKGGLRSSFVSGVEHVYTTETSVSSVESSHSSNTGGDDKNKPANVSNVTIQGSTPPNFTSAVEMREVGIKVEHEGVIDYADPSAVEMNFSVEHHYAPPSTTAQPPPAGDKTIRPLDRRVKFHQAQITTGTTLASGLPRLIGIWRPEGAPEFEGGGKWQAAFIRVDVVPVER
jgi:hypothetical protein